MSVNKLILLGRLGKDPELKYLPNGDAVCTFSLATGESWADKQGQKHEVTDWHNIVIWRKTAEAANQYLKKGSQVYLEGKTKNRSWDKPDGTKGYITEMVVEKMEFCGSKDGGGNRAPTPGEEQAPPSSGSTDAGLSGDDVPF